MTTLLPRTAEIRLRVAVIITCLSFWVYALQCLYHARPIGIVLALGLIIIGLYLWLLKNWARKAARFCLGSALFLFVFGKLLNPLFYEEYSIAHKSFWSVVRWILISIPFVSAWLWSYRTLY